MLKDVINAGFNQPLDIERVSHRLTIAVSDKIMGAADDCAVNQAGGIVKQQAANR